MVRVHVTLEIIQQAKKVGLDLIMRPIHTFHELQPLNVNVFKPFKIAFWKLQNIWSLANIHKYTQKEDLAQWVSLVLKNSMTRNILKGFERMKFWPFDLKVMEGEMGPNAKKFIMESFESDLNTTFYEEIDPSHVNSLEV